MGVSLTITTITDSTIAFLTFDINYDPCRVLFRHFAIFLRRKTIELIDIYGWGGVLAALDLDLCTMDGPDSSYSSFLIHISSNVDNDDKIEPPIQTEYFRSGGAIILIVIESGAKALTSACTRSGIPLYMVVPPDITMLPYKSFRISTSHFIIDENVNL